MIKGAHSMSRLKIYKYINVAVLKIQMIWKGSKSTTTKWNTNLKTVQIMSKYYEVGCAIDFSIKYW